MAILLDGDARTFRAAAYGRPHESTVSFLRHQFEDPSVAMRYANSEFFHSARRMFEESNSERALEEIDSIRRNLARTWDLDEVYELRTREEIQSAKPSMRRWVMANPYIREMFQSKRIEGYGEGYLDHSPKDIGRNHYDYRLATSGMAEFNDTDGWVATTYMDELLEGDKELSYEQKKSIAATWARAELEMLFGDHDVTSVENNKWR